MASLNKIQLIGNLGRDPEVRYGAEGNAVCNISIATTSSWKDKNTGERREETEWHRVVFYNRLAEIAGEYLRKGRPVYVEGRLRTRKWQGQDGKDNYTTEVIADQMQMLGGRDEQGQQQGKPQQRNQPMHHNNSGGGYKNQPNGMQDNLADMSDDIPF